jgi:hypothetical protein
MGFWVRLVGMMASFSVLQDVRCIDEWKPATSAEG